MIARHMPDADFDNAALFIDGAGFQRTAMIADRRHRGRLHCSGRFLFFV
jgi:hypothetical protein